MRDAATPSSAIALARRIIRRRRPARHSRVPLLGHAPCARPAGPLAHQPAAGVGPSHLPRRSSLLAGPEITEAVEFLARHQRERLPGTPVGLSSKAIRRPCNRGRVESDLLHRSCPRGISTGAHPCTGRADDRAWPAPGATARDAGTPASGSSRDSARWRPGRSRFGESSRRDSCTGSADAHTNAAISRTQKVHSQVNRAASPR